MEDPTKPVLTDEDKKRGYTISKWQGRDEAKTLHDNLECLRCSFSTLFQAVMNIHQAENIHVWGRPDGPLLPLNPEQTGDIKPEPTTY
jgi:hypothetical protein